MPSGESALRRAWARLSPGANPVREKRAVQQAEEALRQSEERLQALVTASVDVIWRTDANGEVLFVSQSWEELTGQTPEQTRNFGWLEVIHPDDRDRPRAVWLAAAAEKRSYQSEFRVRTRDGRYRHFQTRGVPILAADGGIREWIGTNTDITERREAESALHE